MATAQVVSATTALHDETINEQTFDKLQEEDIKNTNDQETTLLTTPDQPKEDDQLPKEPVVQDAVAPEPKAEPELEVEPKSEPEVLADEVGTKVVLEEAKVKPVDQPAKVAPEPCVEEEAKETKEPEAGEKEPYEAKAQADKKRYKDEINSYKPQTTNTGNTSDSAMETRNAADLKKILETIEADKKEMALKMQAMQEQIQELLISQIHGEDFASSGSVNKRDVGSLHPNDIKVDIPEYDGKLDPDEFVEWLRTVERVFDYKQTTEDNKVKIVSLKLRKYASTCWSNTCLKRKRAGKEKIQTWPKMKAKMKQKFLPTYYVHNSFSQLHSLRQGTSTVEEYSREFEYLLMKCDVPDDDPHSCSLPRGTGTSRGLEFEFDLVASPESPHDDEVEVTGPDEGPCLGIQMDEKKVQAIRDWLELYAIIRALEHWQQYLISMELILHSDHEALKYIQGQHKLQLRNAKWVEFLQAFNFTI
ncbi:transposon ty3-I gag-pol polyprotein [Tanacetum coccineum]